MIFVGDIAIPFKHGVTLKELPKVLKEKKWYGNLEGAIVESSEELKKKTIVFNDRIGLEVLTEEFDFAGVALANNHIFDAGTFNETVDFLIEKNIPYCGIGANLKDANEPLVIKQNGKRIVILNFGWEVIQCEVTKDDNFGVNPLTKAHVLETVKKTLESFPDASVIPFFHWSYELEAEPQPFERELAKTLIEMGVAGVIGAHPHRIGGFEMYNGKPIVYSLGNWMFRQNYYFNGKLKFPDFCNKELAFEWDFELNEFKFHFFEYDRQQSTLTFSHTEGIESKTMAGLTPFRNMSNDDYKKWYSKNHYHKNKGLPVYYWEDSKMTVKLKNSINKLRDVLLQIVLKFR